MRFSAIFLIFISAAFAADSLNTRLASVMDISPLRGIDFNDDDGVIYAFAKSPKLYSVSHLGGGIILDSISWSGSTIPSGTDVVGRWISVSGGYAYLADWNRGLHIIDVSDPSDLRDVGSVSLSGQPRSVYPVGGSLYVSSNAAGVHLIDISDPESAVAIGTYDIGGTALDAAIWANRTMFVAEDPTGLSAWDLASPSDPLGWLSISGTAGGVEFCGSESLLALTDLDGAVNLVDIAAPSAPTIIDTHRPGGGSLFRTTFSNYLILVAAGENGLWIYDLRCEESDSGFYIPDVCNIVDVVTTGEFSTSGDVACAADADGRIWFVDLSNFIDYIDEADRPSDIALSIYPNPFNSTIKILLSGGVGASDARSVQVGVEIFDITGRLVADLPITNCGSPQFVPTPLIWQPERSLGSGIYLVRAKIGNSEITKRIVYLK